MIFLSLVITMLLMLALVTELIVRPHPWYAPQLVVPLTGMLLGNTVTASAVGLSRFYESMEERRDEVDMMPALGANPWEAARPPSSPRFVWAYCQPLLRWLPAAS